MQSTIFYILSALCATASATPSPNDHVITISDRSGGVWTGEASHYLEARGLEARCDCGLNCSNKCGDCTPGQCNCNGDLGCWSFNNGPYMCQGGPNRPDLGNYDSYDGCNPLD